MARPLLILFFCLGLSFTACSDDPDPRDLDQPAPPLIGGSGSGDGDPGDAGAESDADTGADTDADETPQCSLEPRAAVDPAIQPCCFTDQDCQESDAFDAPLMRCYQSQCTTNGEGLCRVPPASSSNECWTRFDCEDGDICIDAYTGTCEEPLSGALEYFGVCVSN